MQTPGSTTSRRHLIWALVVLAVGTALIIAGLLLGRYVGLHGRADQEAVAVLGVVAFSVGLVKMLRVLGVKSKLWTTAVVLAAVAAAGVILLP